MDYRATVRDGTVFLEPQDLDVAIVGYDADAGRLLYDYERLIEAFALDNDGDLESAQEWVEYNTVRALPYMGSQAPWLVTGSPVEAYEDDDEPATSVVVGDQTYWRVA